MTVHLLVSLFVCLRFFIRCCWCFSSVRLKKWPIPSIKFTALEAKLPQTPPPPAAATTTKAMGQQQKLMLNIKMSPKPKSSCQTDYVPNNQHNTQCDAMVVKKFVIQILFWIIIIIIIIVTFSTLHSFIFRLFWRAVARSPFCPAYFSERNFFQLSGHYSGAACDPNWFVMYCLVYKCVLTSTHQMGLKEWLRGHLLGCIL